MLPSRVLFVISLLLILTGALFAQDKLKITGRVLDTNGAAVTGASDWLEAIIQAVCRQFPVGIREAESTIESEK